MRGKRYLSLLILNTMNYAIWLGQAKNEQNADNKISMLIQHFKNPKLYLNTDSPNTVIIFSYVKTKTYIKLKRRCQEESNQFSNDVEYSVWENIRQSYWMLKSCASDSFRYPISYVDFLRWMISIQLVSISYSFRFSNCKRLWYSSLQIF